MAAYCSLTCWYTGIYQGCSRPRTTPWFGVYSFLILVDRLGSDLAISKPCGSAGSGPRKSNFRPSVRSVPTERSRTEPNLTVEKPYGPFVITCKYYQGLLAVRHYGSSGARNFDGSVRFGSEPYIPAIPMSTVRFGSLWLPYPTSKILD